GAAGEGGGGSTFTIRTLAEVSEVPEARAEPAPAAKPLAPILEGRDKVLVIDDDPTVHDLMTRFLSKEGYHVVTASRGEEGLRLAREIHPRALTLDAMVPGVASGAV